MSKKTVRKTSGRVKDALIKAGPEKSEIQAELNQDFPGRYKLITAVVLGTMAASAGAVTNATINVASPGSGTVAVTTTDDNIVVSGTDTLSIGLASNVTGLTSIAATTVTGTTVNVGDVALTADGNGGISVAGITSSGTISGGTLKVGETDTWSSAGGLAVSGNITTSTGTVKGATVQAGDNITLSGSTGGISGTTLTSTGNITAGALPTADAQTATGVELASATGDVTATGDVKVGAHWDTKTNSLVSNITLDGATGDITTTGAISGEGFSGKILTAYDDTNETTQANKIELNGTTGISTFGDAKDGNVVITSTTDGSSIAVGNNVTSIANATPGVTISDDGDIIASGADAGTGVTISGSTGQITASGTITADGGNEVVLNGSDGTLTTGNTVVSTTGLLVTDGKDSPTLKTEVTDDGIVITNGTVTNKLTSEGLVATAGKFSGDVTVGDNITFTAKTGAISATSALFGGEVAISSSGIDMSDQQITNLANGGVTTNSKNAVNGGEVLTAINTAVAAAKWTAAVYANGTTPTNVDVSTSGTLGFKAGNNMSVSVDNGVITYATSATPTFDSVTVGTATGQQTKIEGGAVTANTVTTGKTSMSTDGVTVTDATNAKVTTTVAASGVTAADGTNTTTLSSTGVVIGTGANKLTTEGLTATTGSFSGDVTVGKNITLDADTGNVTASTATIGGISIGTDGKISNLTSGTIEANNKEAVTGGAVYSYLDGTYLKQSDAGWNIKVGSAEADKIGTDDTVSFSAGSTNVSLSYSADTKTVTVDTAKDVTFDTVKANTSIQVGTGENATKITGDTVSAQTLKAGNSTVTTDGLSVKTADGAKTSTVTTDGLSVSDGTNTASYKANGVTVGKDGANALTTDGLTASAAKIKGDVSVGDQITLAADTGTITATNAKFGNLTFNTTGVEIAGGPSLTSNGIDAANLTIRNVKAGELSATSTEAVNGSQLFATNQAVEANTNSITALRGDTTRLKNRINRVGAQSAALAALQPLPFAEGQNVSVSIGAGAYRGAAAGALGIYYRPTENMMLSLGGSVTAGDVMGNVGFSYRFGTSGLTTEKPQTMAARISSLSKENADLTAQLTAARTRLESQETRLLKLEALVEKLSAGK